MSNTIQSIQVLAKIGKVMSRIVFICCLIGAIGCLIGAISLSAMPESLKIGGVTIHSIIENSGKVSMGDCYASMAVGAIMCAAECIISRYALTYFKNELEAGTPFTMEGAEEMKKLGIRSIVISLVSVILCHVAHSLINMNFTDVTGMEISNYSAVGLGIAFIIVSLLCKAGAEMKGNE